MKTLLKIALIIMCVVCAKVVEGAPPVVDSVKAWKKQAIKLKVDLNTFLTAKAYAKNVSMLTIPNDSIKAWKRQAIRLDTDLNTYLTALLMSSIGSYPVGYTAALTGTGTVNVIPKYISANSFTNSIISQPTSSSVLINGTGTFSTSVGIGVNGAASGLTMGAGHSIYFEYPQNVIYGSGSNLSVNGYDYVSFGTAGNTNLYIHNGLITCPTGFPTSPTGLPSGTIWSNLGILTVVP